MSGPTLASFVAERVTRSGEVAALIDRDRPVSWRTLDDEARRVATALAARGIGAGDRVAVWLPNVPAWLACVYACARLGAIAVSVNTRFRASEVEDIVGRSGCKALVFWPAFRGIDFAGILAACDPARLAALGLVIAYDEGEAAAPHALGRTVVRYHDLVTAAPMNADHGGPQAGCVIFTTSGTTKAPKFVLHDQATVIRHAQDVADGFGYRDPAASILLTAPLCGVFGFCNAMAAAEAARPLVMLPTFDASDAARAVQRYHVTHTNATDEMIALMLAAAPGERPFPSVKFFGFAAFSPAHADLPMRAAARGLNVVGLYGSSEVQALFARQSETAPASDRWLAGGRPVAREAAVRATDPETRVVMPHGMAGELEFKGPSLMAGYFGNEAATREAITADGFFRSGDLGSTTEDGRFVFLARLGDAMRLSGFLVSPAEIEDVLQSFPGVAAAQVVAAATPEGFRPVAFVILAGGAAFDEAALAAHCATRIAKFKVPVRIQPVEAFPVTPGANATKIQKHKLREIAEGLLARSR